MLRRLMLASVAAWAIGCTAEKPRPPLPSQHTPAATQAGSLDSDTPARIDGRVAPTIRARSKRDSYEGRLKQIEEALRLRAEAIAKFPPPTLVCPRVADGSVKLDGDLGEAAWRDAPVAVIARDSRTGSPSKTEARVKAVWDSNYLYFAFDLDDKQVAATLTKHDDDLWKEDVAEVFLDANNDEASYIELEVNALGTTYDGSIADYRPESQWRIDRLNFDIDATIHTFRAHGLKTGIKVDGKINDPEGDDRGWTCEIAIPWSDIARGTNTQHAPPRDGDVWRVGLFRNDVNPKRGNEPASEEYTAWNPSLTWFHRPWSFGRLVFIER
ncbi:MAG: carbohydrate-binding family 9-like protein [Planctomycetes bacterium]|nr:carbohydrate-binding family 9-like protein [Planctomycetota bacterium]